MARQHRLPDGMRHEGSPNQGFTHSVSLPVDEDGLAPLQCPAAAHRFKVTLTRAPQASPAIVTARTAAPERPPTSSWPPSCRGLTRAVTASGGGSGPDRGRQPPVIAQEQLREPMPRTRSLDPRVLPRPACGCAPAAGTAAPAPPHRGRRAVPARRAARPRAPQPPDQARLDIQPPLTVGRSEVGVHRLPLPAGARK
jgi:hypothetical protein